MDHPQAPFSGCGHTIFCASPPTTKAPWVGGLPTREHFLRSFHVLAGCLILGVLAAGHAHATTTNSSAILTNDSQVDLITVTISQTSAVTFETDSYGGGTLGGVTTAAGGFVPILSLFGPTGTFLVDDGGDGTCQAGMNADPATGICDDAEISKMLTAGTYTLAVTEFFNYPNGPNLSNGFSTTGNFTEAICGATSGAFFEVDLAPCPQRNGNVAVTETATPLVAATPEPGSLWLSALPIVALGFARWRQSLVRA